MPIQEKIIIIEKCDDKVRVGKAMSLDDQIRFYLNDDLYVAATEEQNSGKYKISFGDESIEENDSGGHKKGKMRYQKLILLQVVSSLFIIIVAIMSIAIISNWRFSLFAPCFAVLLIGLTNSAILNLSCTSKKLRGKHSAEHMMIKYMEENNQIPTKLSEVRKYSPLNLSCGSRFNVETEAENFSLSLISIVITIVFSLMIQWIFNNPGLTLITAMLAYIILSFGIPILYRKNKNIFSQIVKPIKNTIILINQLTLTSRKVKDDDLLLAYLAARMWMMIVYPEFYDSERDDTIWRENIVNIKIEEPDW